MVAATFGTLDYTSAAPTLLVVIATVTASGTKLDKINCSKPCLTTHSDDPTAISLTSRLPVSTAATHSFLLGSSTGEKDEPPCADVYNPTGLGRGRSRSGNVILKCFNTWEIEM